MHNRDNLLRTVEPFHFNSMSFQIKMNCLETRVTMIMRLPLGDTASLEATEQSHWDKISAWSSTTKAAN